MANFLFANSIAPKPSTDSTAQGKVKTVDIVPTSMAKPMIEPDHASGDTDVQTAPTTAADDEDLTDAAFEEHSKEGAFMHEDRDDDTLGEDGTVNEEDFLRDLKNLAPLGRSSTRTRSQSILKSSSSEMYISEKRRSWMCLPKPDMMKIRAQSCPTTSLERDAAEKKNVKFDRIEVRNYSQTLGDNPSCSYGPPISLDWEYEEGGTVALEEFEANRGPRRKLRQMMLNYYHRKNILQWKVGYTEEELKKAQKSAEKIKSQRALTRAMLPACKVEEAFQSAARKARRAFKSK